MPWHLAKSGSCPASKPWAVIKDSDGTVEGCHPTKAAARKQQAALYAAEPAASSRTNSRTTPVMAERAQWTTAYINDLPDSCFLYIEPGGKKDEGGKTVPRTLRHFPVKDAAGKVDLPHLRNALARIPQSNLSAGVKETAMAKARRMLESAQGRSEPEEPETVEAASDTDRFRGIDAAEIHMREDDGNGAVVEGRMMPYNEWTEVDSPIEGHFLERFAPGALAKTMQEQAGRVRFLFQHGRDSVVGKQAIGAIEEMRDESDGAYFRARLLPGLPELLVAGLRRGLYGSSIRFGDIKRERISWPKTADHNPKQLPEETLREARLREISVVTFPAYTGATVLVRSLTDEFLLPPDLLEFVGARAAALTDTTPDEEPGVSRSTRPTEPISRDEFLHKIAANKERGL